MIKSNLWILTEERPKRETIKNILYKFSKDNKVPCFIDTIRILPKLDSDRNFSFLYEVIGYKSEKIKKVLIRTVSGYSSFVDFLLFYQDNEPTNNSIPLYGIEETKTDDAESRNTGVFQRASKFVYIDYFYPRIKKVMLYSLQVDEKKKPTQTNIFGTRCLLTIGVEILGKKYTSNEFKPFKDVDEVIKFKNSMRNAPTGNVPIAIKKTGNSIEVSGRLYKSNGLAHDPNIGALSLICATLRKLGWKKRIVITKHGLKQRHIVNNKFVRIANHIKIDFDGLTRPSISDTTQYWKYEKEGEKLGTIFIHLVVENFTSGESIFEQHAGCEKGYFITKEGKPIALKKYTDREKYKSGEKDKIVFIPDLILIDFDCSEIINIEGKKYRFRTRAIKELNNFDAIENFLVKPNYPKYKIVRTVVLYGGTQEKVIEIEVGFLLNKNGKLILGIKAPKLFQEAIRNLVAYWGVEKKEPEVEKSDLFLSDVIPDEEVPRKGKYSTHLPVLSLQAAATAFSEEQKSERLGWKNLGIRKKLDDQMFITQVIGKSMEPTIPDGKYCIFRFYQGGSRNGRVVLVESRQVTDPETHQKFTVKRYRSEKEKVEGDQWRHKKIFLSPDNKDFDDIVLENVSEDDFRVVAEFVAVL